MKNTNPVSINFAALCIAACAALAAATAHAHVVLPAGGATVGTEYDAAFRVGHACSGSALTTSIKVQLPQGFAAARPQLREGWTLATQGRDVTWTANTPTAALAGAGEFIVRGKLPRKPGVLWFKVLQVCDKGSSDWAEIPAPGSIEKLALPAARLDVLPPGVAPLDVRNAWVQPPVPGQTSAAVFMKLNAPSGGKLVGATVAAGTAGFAELHGMKMEGDIMKMREMRSLDLPARQAVELSPSGNHMMLMDLKRPLAKGDTVALTLRFEDAKGVKSSLPVNVSVGAPEGAPSAPGGHNH